MALVNASDQVIDQAGMSADSAEGSPLPPLNGNLDQSYERKPGGAEGSCYDSDDNAADFRLIQPSNPQDSHAEILLTICAAPTETPPPSPTDTFTTTDVYTSTFTFTSEWTETVTDTPTQTGTPTKTFTYTRTSTFTLTAHPSNTPTFTKTDHPSRTPSETRTPSLTKTLSPSRTPSETRTPSLTKTASPSRTFSPTKTVTRTKTLTPIPGYVAINEFLPLPASDWNEDALANEKDEFIELINLGSTPIKLKGWKLDSGAQSASFHLPDVTIAPGEILVFFRFETGLPLSDGGGTVRLVKSGGQTADQFHYSPAIDRNRTWCRLPGKASELLFACIPTPGQPNVAFPIGVADPDDGRICSLPDTVPAGIILAECEGVGDDVWNEAEREQFWLVKQGKWDVFVE